MKTIAIIPARSGSKGLPDKNIKPLNGKPLLAYSIEAALASGLFDTVHVSTDSERYADIARQYGADEPFLRSAETSSDTASSEDAIREVLRRYEEMGQRFDAYMLLQPTSPLRTADDIRAAFGVMEEKNANAVVSVCETDHSPLWSNTLPDSGDMAHFLRPEVLNTRRQDIPTYYRLNGAIYLVKTVHLCRASSIYSDGCYAYIMSAERSVDIDSPTDFMIAECLLNARSKEQTD